MSGLIGDDIKAVLFDHDDTLVGTIEAKWAQHKHIARKWYNKELLDKELREHWGKPLRVLLGALYETDDLDQAMKRVKRIHADFPKRLFEETLGVLERLRAADKYIGVITSTSRYSFEYDLKDLGIPKALFDFIQTEDDASFHKPDPRAFDPAKIWLAEHDIKPYQVVYIGDSLFDMKASQGAGFHFIGVISGLISSSQFKKAGAVYVSNLSELL